MKSSFVMDLDGVVVRGEMRDQYRDQINNNDYGWFRDQVSHFRGFKWSCEMIKSLAKDHIILFVTARNEEFRQQTVNWIKHHIGIKNYKLLMRSDEEGIAQTPDVDVKRRIFNDKIYGRFDVLAAFDDKKEIINLWRSLGITALHNVEET